MDKIDIGEKFEVQYCIENWLRDEQIKQSTARIKGRIEPVYEKRNEPIALVSFAPSLNDTWELVKDFKYIITCSGSHKFLIDHGIIPTWHIEVDPREHKIALLGTPHQDITYIIASSCHPKYFDWLEKHNVKIKLWHVFDSYEEGFRVLPRGEWALTGGASVGLRTMTIARFFGFTDFHVFGMDGCVREGMTHTTLHPNAPKKISYTEYNGKKYYTTPSMLEVARQTLHEMDQLKDVSFKFYGEGLVQEMVKDYVRDPNNKEELAIGINKPKLLSDEYKQLNIQLHKDNLRYGAGGEGAAKAIIDLYNYIKAKSLLDYGAQREDDVVLTSNGWVKFKNLNIGDFVIGGNGELVKITNIFDRGRKDVYRVFFNDNTYLDVDAGHFWAVRTTNHQKRNQPFIIKTTSELLLSNLQWDNPKWIYKPYKWRIPMTKPINFLNNTNLPLDPYLLGVLLGDGSMTQNVMFITDSKQLPIEVSKVLPNEIELIKQNKKNNNACCYRIVKKSRKRGVSNIIKDAIISLGLHGLRSWEKFIPKEYLYSNVQNRISLLQGLLDTDGEIRIKHISYSTVSWQLSQDIIFLVRSLGCNSKLSRRITKYQNGFGRESYIIHIKPSKEIVLTRSKKYNERKEYFANKIITNIQKLNEQDRMLCISVDSIDGLYVTKDFIVTHNCGKGYLAKNIPFPIWEYDPCVIGKDETPRPADLVTCLNVLEHVEPDYLELVLNDIQRNTLICAYFIIDTKPARKVLSDGRNTHLIQEGKDWWSEMLSNFFEIKEDSIIEKGGLLFIIANPYKIDKDDVYIRDRKIDPKYPSYNTRQIWLSEVIAKNEYTSGVEVGCAEGRTTEYLLKNCPKLELYAVDLWSNIEEEIIKSPYFSWNFKEVQRIFNEKTKPYTDRLHILQGLSWEMAEKVEDNSLDFVFIDANHSYDSVKKDILAWNSKLKPNGLMCGHDTHHEGVTQALAEVIPNWKDVGMDHCWEAKKEDVLCLQ